jgi:hypothetical protein
MKLWGMAISAAVVLTASGCSAGHSNTDPDFTVTETIDGQVMRVDLAPGKSKGLAVWFHGQGGTAQTRMNEAWLNALRVDGWAVASSDFHGNAWGNPEAVKDTDALVRWASEKSGHSAGLFIAGSMGGLASLNSMAAGVASPNCWYGIQPVVDQSTVGNVPDSGNQILAAYGGTVPASSNPARNLGKLPAVKYRIVSSPDDTWVPANKNAAVLTAGLKAVGSEVSTLTVKGEHGDPSHFNSADLLAFATTCV